MASNGNSGQDRRRDVRIPVSVGFECNVKGLSPDFFYTTVLYNYSKGGICIKWNFCDECTGYSEGAIHPDCIFSPYDYRKEDSDELVFHIELANYDQDLNFRGKAVYTWKDDNNEKIGIIFTNISDETLDFMHKVFSV